MIPDFVRLSPGLEVQPSIYSDHGSDTEDVMSKLQSFRAIGLSAVAILAGSGLSAQQAGDPATLIREKLISEIKLTKATDAHDDIVTAGDVVQLHKDGLMMCSSASSYAYSNTYQNGILSGTLNNRAKDAARSFVRGKLPFGGGSTVSGSANNGCASRKFVSGEKFWVTDIRIAKDNSGIIVSTFSDPYNDVRYYGEIKFPFPGKTSVPPVDDEVKTVDEVLTVVPADDTAKGQNGDASRNSSGANPTGNGQVAGGSAQSAQAPPAPADHPALAPIAPPPPPSDPPAQQTKTIAVGQSKDDVLATWGPPAKDIKLSNKEIFVYADMRVTFIGSKVSDVH